MKKKNSYNFEELISCGNGDMFGEGNAKLPLPPMLMFDRLTTIQSSLFSFVLFHCRIFCFFFFLAMLILVMDELLE